MRKRVLAVAVGVIGTFGLLAAAHHGLVVAWRGDGQLAQTAAATCAACHGDRFNRASAESPN